MRRSMLASGALMLVLGGCGHKTVMLPEDPIEKAASCAAIAAASERGALGVKGDLSAEAQGRILHYAMLTGAEGGSFAADRANAVSQRAPAAFEKTVKGKWETLKPACAAAYPATAVTKPVLPDQPLERVLECQSLVGYVRKALGGANGGLAETLTDYGVLADKLANKSAPIVAKAGLQGDALKARSDAALAAAARLGQPMAVIAACKGEYVG